MVAATAAAGLVVGILSGCGDPVVPPLPTPTATAAFASDAEALAAAEAAYAAYQLAVDEALASASDDGLEHVAGGAALERAVEAARQFAESGARQVGRSVVLSVEAADLAGLTQSSTGGYGQVYACLSLADVVVREPDGSVSRSEVEVLPMLVGLEYADRRLRVVEEEIWDGDNFCG